MAHIQLFPHSEDNTPDYDALAKRIQSQVFDKTWAKNGYTVKMLSEEYDITESAVRRYIKQGQAILKRVVYQPSAEEYVRSAYWMKPVMHYAAFLEFNREQLSDAITAVIPEIPSPPLDEKEHIKLGIEVLFLNMSAYNVLMNQSGIRTVEDLLSRSKQQLAATRYLSKDDLTHIMAQLIIWCNDVGIDTANYPLYTKPVEDAPQLQEIFPGASDVSIQLLDLHRRHKDALTQNNIRTINQLMEKSISELIELRGLNIESVNRITQALTNYFEDGNLKTTYTGTITDPIDAIEPNTRAQNALHKWGVETIEDLLNVPASYVQTTRNVGNRTRNHLMDNLQTWANKHHLDISDYPFMIDESEHLKDSVFTLGLNNRAENALWINEVETVEQLLQTTPDKLLKFRNMGQKSLIHILEKVTQWGEQYYIHVGRYPLFTSKNEKD